MTINLYFNAGLLVAFGGWLVFVLIKTILEAIRG